ncbi:hypothetical protein D3C73_1513420 [compost metagenome]
MLAVRIPESLIPSCLRVNNGAVKIKNNCLNHRFCLPSGDNLANRAPVGGGLWGQKRLFVSMGYIMGQDRRKHKKEPHSIGP